MKGKISSPRVKICHSVYEGSVRVSVAVWLGPYFCCNPFFHSKMIQRLTKIMLLHCHSSVLDQINPSIFKRENTGARDFLSLELPDWGLFTVTINIDEQLRKWLVYFSVPGPGSDVTGSQPSAHSGYLCIWTWVNRLRRSIKLLLVKLSPARRCFPSSVLRSSQQNGEILRFYHKDKDW